MSCVEHLLFFTALTSKEPCLQVGGDISLRAEQVGPQVGVHQRISLSQSRLSTAYKVNNVALRTAMNTVQSAGAGSYMGIDGESYVWQIQLSEINVYHNGVRFSGGLNEDLWVKSQNEAWGLRELAWGAAERDGWMSRADVGGSAVRSGAWFDAAVRISNGEGMRSRERNNGKNTEVLVGAHHSGVRLELYARDGSLGLSSFRNHRLGVRASYTEERFRLGSEYLKSYGLPYAPKRGPWLSSSWGIWEFEIPISVVARFDWLQEEKSVHQQTVWSALGYRLEEGCLWLGMEHQKSSEEWRSFSGSEALSQSYRAYIQITGHLDSFFNAKN